MISQSGKLSTVNILRDGDPPVYFDQCGWDGFFWGGKRRVHFRFSDSDKTGINLLDC